MLPKYLSEKIAAWTTILKIDCEIRFFNCEDLIYIDNANLLEATKFNDGQKKAYRNYQSI